MLCSAQNPHVRRTSVFHKISQNLKKNIKQRMNEKNQSRDCSKYHQIPRNLTIPQNSQNSKFTKKVN